MKVRMKVHSIESFEALGGVIGINLQRINTTTEAFAMCFNLPVAEFNAAPWKEGDIVDVEFTTLQLRVVES